MGHYEEWRQKRLKAITDYYGIEAFKGKTLLELGCGHAHIGKHFHDLGSVVTVCDSRKQHIDTTRQMFPELDARVIDVNNYFPFKGPIDFIINMGLLYHLTDPVYCLKKSCETAINLVIESEVLDSQYIPELRSVSENNLNYDQSMSSYGVRMSVAGIEYFLEFYGFQFERIDDARCNSGPHRYDWVPSDSKRCEPGFRKMWLCKKP